MFYDTCVQPSLAMKIPGLCLVLAMTTLASVPAAGAVMSAPGEGQAAVLFPPGWDHGRVAIATAEAGTGLVRFGSLGNIAIVDLEPGDTPRLRLAGAVLVLDPLILGGCLAGEPSLSGTMS